MTLTLSDSVTNYKFCTSPWYGEYFSIVLQKSFSLFRRYGAKTKSKITEGHHAGHNTTCLLTSILTLIAPSKICTDDIYFYFFFNFSKKTSHDISCESIHMKYQDLFSLKNKNKKKKKNIFRNVVCCSCDWRFKG